MFGTLRVLLQNQVIFAAAPFFFWRAIRGVPNITFFGSSEAGSSRKCDFCVRQTDLLKFCCSRKVISGCFRFKQCFPESSVCKPTAQFSDIECCCEDKKAGFVVGLPSGEESSEPVIRKHLQLGSNGSFGEECLYRLKCVFLLYLFDDTLFLKVLFYGSRTVP